MFLPVSRAGTLFGLLFYFLPILFPQIQADLLAREDEKEDSDGNQGSESARGHIQIIGNEESC